MVSYHLLERENGAITFKRTASMLSPNRAEPEPHTPSKEDSSAVSEFFFWFLFYFLLSYNFMFHAFHKICLILKI